MGLFDLFRRKSAPSESNAIAVGAEADEHADLASLILQPLYLQAMMNGMEPPLSATAPQGLGKASGYIFAFSVAVFSASKIFDPERKDRLMIVLAVVFQSMYGEEDGARILEATATATPQVQPGVHEGYERGRWDADQWVSNDVAPTGLIPLLSGFEA